MDAPRPTPWLRRAPSWRCPIWRDREFAAFAARARDGIVRARVSPPILPLLAAALWRSRERRDAARAGDRGRGRRRGALAGRRGGDLPARRAGRLPALARRAVRQRHRPRAAPGGRAPPGAGGAGRRRPGGRLRGRAARAGARRRRRGRARSMLELGTRARAGDGRRASWSAAGYTRVDTVEERGEVSVRGGLVDVFPTTGREPLRDRVLRRRDRAAVRVLGVHPALAPRPGRARSSTRPASRRT